jgi:hypothetical protein
MALKGTLKDFGIADIFQLIGQQGKTGVLHLVEGDQEVHVSFKDGNVVRAESSTRKKKELLGDMLVRAGLITERQLQEALEEQKRTLKRLGDILVAAGATSRESLKEMAQLQTTETLYRLFFWKNGTYAFEVAEVDFDPETLTPVRSESVLMEGFRRVDEWPLIRKKISNNSMTFELLKDLPEAPGGQDDLDSALDDAFGEFEGQGKKEEPEHSEGEFKNIGANERLVFGLVLPGRDVQEIVDRSRLGEFEACKALFNLVNLGYLRAVSAADTGTSRIGARARWSQRLVVLAGRVAMALVLLGAVLLIATRLELGSVAERRFADPAARRLASRAQLSRIRAAIGVFELRRGRSPESLKELVSHGILSEEELSYPWGQPFYYRRTGETSYVLLPPIR